MGLYAVPDLITVNPRDDDFNNNRCVDTTGVRAEVFEDSGFQLHQYGLAWFSSEHGQVPFTPFRKISICVHHPTIGLFTCEPNGRCTLAMDLAQKLAANLRARRGAKTQDVFARKLGISRATLSRLESGAQNTTIATLEQIAKSLRCDVGELLTPPTK